MEVQILKRKENPLLNRVEVTFKAVHKAEGTPPRDAMRSELAKHLKATKDVVVIDRLESSFGRYESVGYAKVYPSKDVAASVERLHILVRNRLATAEVKAPKAGEAPKKPEPKPAEKKEAPKAEAKPAKPEHKPEAKAEHRPEPKVESKPERPHAKEEKKPAEKKDEHKPGHKPEHKLEPKAEGKKEPKKKEGK